MICVECGQEFLPAEKSKRLTCSRPCSTRLAWKTNPGKRLASIKKARTTPESRARSTEVNHRRWAKPGERAKLSEWNRQRWADPAIADALTAAIIEGWTTDRRRTFSEVRTRQWAEDEAYRAATVAGIRRDKRSPEKRALFSALLRARWQIPEWREMWLVSMDKRMADPAQRAKFSAIALRRWEECKTVGQRWDGRPIATSKPRGSQAAEATPISRLPLTAAERELAEIARFIAERGVTRLPAAFVAETTADIPDADRAAIRAHNQAIEEQRASAWIVHAKRGGAATARRC
jgi:hypothetical protein